MIGLEDHQALARDIDIAHAAGVRLKPTCEIAGIDLRTLQRWQATNGLAAAIAGRRLCARPFPCQLRGRTCAFVLAAPRQRRQCLCRVAVSYRQVPAGIPRQGLCRSRPGPRLGQRFRTLVQLRPPSQRHPLRQSGSAPCRGRSGDSGYPTRAAPRHKESMESTMSLDEINTDADWRAKLFPEKYRILHSKFYLFKIRTILISCPP
jgi:hypothetical protein